MSILVDKISAHTLSHALLVPLLTKSDNNNKGVFKQVFANLVIALGGGFLSSFLLGQPFDVITDQWLVSAYVVAFFITFSLPPLEPGFLWNTLIAVDAVHRGLVLVAAIETVIALLGLLLLI